MDDPKLQLRLAKWREWCDKETMPTSWKDIEDLVEQGNVEKLRERLFTRMAFGTSGLRGVRGGGFATMNNVVIQQTTQGLLAYLEKNVPDLKEKGVVIGYDARYWADNFAIVTSKVFLSHGVKVYLFHTDKMLSPTPMVPFSVLHYGAAAGIVITASHNPQEYNGYKVYWSNGVSIIPPHDKGIAQSIDENEELWPDVDQVSIAQETANGLLIDPTNEACDAYMKRIVDELSFTGPDNPTAPLKITYTAMHGVGYPYCVKSFAAFNLPPFIPVKEQIEYDPMFSTVRFPNPEEGGALDIAIRTADAAGSTVVLANDPDADRLGVAIKSSAGEWKILSGDEIGSLLGWWMIVNHSKAKYPKRSVVASTVSSKQLKAIAEAEGVRFDETLTGFKWMCTEARHRYEEGYKVLLAYEESIGYMCGWIVRDKDGVSGSAAFAEMANFLARKGLTCIDQLEAINQKYGRYVTNNSYYICRSKEKIDKIFARIRSLKWTSDKYPIKYIRDLTLGIDTSMDDGKATLPVDPSSHMITYIFENGMVMTIRTSGTEPKIKYYTELGGKQSKSELQQTLDEMVALTIDEWLQPSLNELEPAAEK